MLLKEMQRTWCFRQVPLSVERNSSLQEKPNVPVSFDWSD